MLQSLIDQESRGNEAGIKEGSRAAPLIVMQPNVYFTFIALAVSGVSRMGCFKPKVSEDPAGSTAT